jgi:hypothetical protein
LFFHVSGDRKIVPTWSEDFSGRSLQEVVALMTENRAWHKEIRRQTGVLVDSKLAKEISREEYCAHRQRFNDEVAECRRRTAVLTDEIVSRR